MNGFSTVLSPDNGVTNAIVVPLQMERPKLLTILFPFGDRIS